MPWPGPQLRIILLLLILAVVGPPGLRAEANVGCLFSERICQEDEWCHNDFAFGQCLSVEGFYDEESIYRYSLSEQELHDLSKELRRLFALGYRWGHSYTQCRLQGMLYALREEMDFDLDSCIEFSDNDLEGALRAMEGQEELDPQEVAIIKYTPSVDNPHANFADEVYYPPMEQSRQQEKLRRKILGPGKGIDLDIPDPLLEYTVSKRTWLPQMRRRAVTPFFDGRYGIPKYRRSDTDEELPDSMEFLHEHEGEIAGPRERFLESNAGVEDVTEEEMYPLIKLLTQLQMSPREVKQYLSPANYKKLSKMIALAGSENEPPNEVLLRELIAMKSTNDLPQQLGPDERFTITYNTPDGFRNGWESRDSLLLDEDLPEPRIYFDEDDEAIPAEHGSGVPEEIFTERKFEFLGPRNEVFRELKQKQQEEDESFNRKWKGKPMLYSEGGSEPEGYEDFGSQQDREIALRDDLSVWDRYNMGFKRPERLDVKKPGPPFDPAITEPASKGANEISKKDIIPSMMKKEPRGVNPNPGFSEGVRLSAKEGDCQYVHVEFKDSVKDWKQGMEIIWNIFNLLHLEKKDFTDSQVHSGAKSVSFKVLPNNNRGFDAGEVARHIGDMKDEINRLWGLEITSVGIGNKDKMEDVFFMKINQENQLIVVSLVCGVLIALILATIVLTFIRRHVKSKEKMQGLARPDTEASKDYQDLCRARMATKGQSAEGSTHDKGRITSLSRESEQSPSSRSSTSSWSEEPALHNMDISTGHMVLSYMEDHLKNKDRLDQEWVALCAYVAEPCETSVALKKENIGKNRYPEVVPYDHARVVLNELSNASASDYINASSITDHDPRNPAYIATQGPLPQTAPDFWQLIWEQGAVVIVMLSRLTEGGAAMCHRYWPEEGSEVYHIYEVHLVSEHIWCDDYLVRSFYLKNVKTGETRTVTQFHFLSWPEAGVPASTKALLEFRRKVNKSYRGRSCPIVVHCSDGAGRTGTYCLIDMVLSRMAKGAKEIDIAATLEHLRDQRPRMVATKQQFEFVLTAVAEEVHAILKALPPQPSPLPQPPLDK
ncbi:receptor-type tyrosine-protein phosphatase N2 [Euwallacea fornicatus]|uniref:receptor-type tyrosine-protein phosphatase N2 n=1 Tax=Euwallacea fornicatus TaxID=995702 RepID=UPI00338FB29E